MPPHASYLFKHALLQDAAYGTLLREPRRALHARIAEALESQFTEIAENQPELLARHCTEAGLIEKAAGLWGKAGLRSAHRSALVEAAAQLTRALDQIATLPATPALRRAQIKLQIAVMSTLWLVKGPAAWKTISAAEQARLLIEQAKKLGEPLEDPLLLFAFLYGYWTTSFVAFNGDAMRERAVQFMALAEKQGATAPLMIGHRLMGTNLLYAGDFAQGRAYLDQSIALFNPLEHRPLGVGFGTDAAVAALCLRSLALWALGHPVAALADAEQALNDARKIGLALTSMFALHYASLTHTACGNYATAEAQYDELIALAHETGVSLYGALGTSGQGSVLALVGKASDAVHKITSGISTMRSTGIKAQLPFYLSFLASAYAQLGQLDDAWRCMDEAMSTIETTKERWMKPEANRIAGEITLMSPLSDAAKSAILLRARSHGLPPTTSQILGTPRRHEPRPPLARPGQGAASA
jgi:tetratricopeptide (TPR) repeat protein